MELRATVPSTIAWLDCCVKVCRRGRRHLRVFSEPEVFRCRRGGGAGVDVLIGSDWEPEDAPGAPRVQRGASSRFRLRRTRFSVELLEDSLSASHETFIISRLTCSYKSYTEEKHRMMYNQVIVLQLNRQTAESLVLRQLAISYLAPVIPC